MIGPKTESIFKFPSCLHTTMGPEADAASSLSIFVCLLRIIETRQLQTPQGLCGVGQPPASLCWKILVSENKSRKVPITVFKYHTFPSQGNPKSI